MKELISLVSEKAGITEEQARLAVETVAGFLKARVPAPYAGYIDMFMGASGGSSGGGLSGLADSIGDMLGGGRK